MKFLKKIWAWEKAQMMKPETLMMMGIVGGVLIGIGTDNIGLGIALGLVFGISGYSSCKKKKEVTKVADETVEVSDNVSN